MRINYDFGDLEVFLAVMAAGSFRIAADRLSLSQSAITRRIQKLELALDSVLFERTTRNVVPTLAAKRLRARAEAMLGDAHETVAAMRDESVAFAHQRNLVITIAILPTIVASILPQALHVFRDEGHQQRIRLLDLASNEAAEAVVSGEADFGLCALTTEEPNTTFEFLFEDRFVVAIPSDHTLASQHSVSVADLVDVPLTLPTRRTGNRILIEEAVSTEGAQLRWTFETERTSTALALVRGGTCLALVPNSAVAGFDHDEVCIRPILDNKVKRPIGMLQRQRARHSEGVLALMEAIRQCVPSSLKGGA